MDLYCVDGSSACQFREVAEYIYTTQKCYVPLIISHEAYPHTHMHTVANALGIGVIEVVNSVGHTWSCFSFHFSDSFAGTVRQFRFVSHVPFD